MLPGYAELPLHGPLPSLPNRDIETVLVRAGYACIAGVDEVGRGCLAGPVVAAAAVLPDSVDIPGLTDSKQMTAEARFRAAALIRERAQVGVGICSPAEIDRWNILRASLEAMRRALAALPSRPDFVLVDGNQTLVGISSAQQTVIKGDARSLSIAAASVIAKVERDAIMGDLHARYPEFGWDQNVGYPTADHFEALSRLGPSEYHRKSFRLRVGDDSQMTLF